MSEPQTLNRYVYARDNPERYTDPTGNLISYWGDPNPPVPGHITQFILALIGTGLSLLGMSFLRLSDTDRLGQELVATAINSGLDFGVVAHDLANRDYVDVAKSAFTLVADTVYYILANLNAVQYIGIGATLLGDVASGFISVA
jgi:hypothetical protein